MRTHLPDSPPSRHVGSCAHRSTTFVTPVQSMLRNARAPCIFESTTPILLSSPIVRRMTLSSTRSTLRVVVTALWPARFDRPSAENAIRLGLTCYAYARLDP